MKRTIIFSMMAASLLFAGCTMRDITKGSAGAGSLTLKVASEGQYVTKADDVVNNFKITISREDGYEKVFERYADMPQVLDLGSGDYTIVATSPRMNDAAFDQPIYTGSANFTIKTGELTPVSLTCSLTNMMVTFKLSDNFKNELSAYTVTITNAASWTADDAESRTLVWDKAAVDANTPGYFTVAPLLIKVDGYRAIDNSETHAQMVISQVAAKDHHILNLDARVTGQLGGENGGVELVIDNTVNEKDQDIDIPGWDEVPVDGGEDGSEDPETSEDPATGSEDPQPSTAPTMSWDANPTFAPTPIQDVMDVNIQINAQEKIKTFQVAVESVSLSETIAALKGDDSYSYAPGNPFIMDLIDDQDMIDALADMGLGLPLGDELKGQTQVPFSLSSLIPMIAMYPADPGTEHYFTLMLSDELGQSLEQKLTFVTQ